MVIKVKMRGFPVLALLCLGIFLSASAAAQEPPRIASIHANLFSSKTGSFSKDMLAKDAPELGNVTAGEFASVSVFVSVKVDLGNRTDFARTAKVRLTAIENGSMPFAAKPVKNASRILLNSLGSIGPVNKDGSTYVGFWLPQTGCRTIELKASLVGVKNPSAVTATLPFACYE